MHSINKLNDLLDQVVFLPSPEQRRIKAAFWALYADMGTQPITLSLAQTLTGESRLKAWWGLPGFREWFLNKDEFRQRVEYLAHLALDTAEEILSDPKANPSARVNMAKLMVEVAGRMPNKWEQKKFADDFINKMSKDELKAYLEKVGVKYLNDPNLKKEDKEDVPTN
jgi:hypothetical protein